MPSFARTYYSALWATLHRIFGRFHDLFGFIFSFFQRRLLVPSTEQEKESTSNPSVDLNPPTTPTPACQTFTIKPQQQVGLEIVGVGAAGQVYGVDDDIVLKACRVYEPPGDDASPRDRWFYASETLFHFNLMRDERTVLQLLETRPHPNIVEAIDTDHAEGVYLRKHLRLPEPASVSQPVRIRWYHDIVRALEHIHGLGIAHSDVRIENILVDQEGRAVLCDFSASSPFGHPNPALPHAGSPVPINGLSEFVSDATDRFAAASLIFEMETGSKPGLAVGDSGDLILPRIQTGTSGLDMMIQKAWLGQYDSTAQMCKDADALPRNMSRDPSTITQQQPTRDVLRHHIRHWRETRENCLGCVLQALPADDELTSLAAQYGWDKEEGLRFRNHKAL